MTQQVLPTDLDVNYQILVKYHDILGWQNLIKGRILSYIIQIQREYLNEIETFRTAESWTHRLIEQLLRLTHRQ